MILKGSFDQLFTLGEYLRSREILIQFFHSIVMIVRILLLFLLLRLSWATLFIVIPLISPSSCSTSYLSFGMLNIVVSAIIGSIPIARSRPTMISLLLSQSILSWLVRWSLTLDNLSDWSILVKTLSLRSSIMTWAWLNIRLCCVVRMRSISSGSSFLFFHKLRQSSIQVSLFFVVLISQLNSFNVVCSCSDWL